MGSPPSTLCGWISVPYSDPEKRRERGREYNRKRYAATPEKAQEANRKWRAANPEKHREGARAASRKWREANPEKTRAKAREYMRKSREINPEKDRESSRKWRKANPEKRRASGRKRRALLLGTVATLTTDEWLDRVDEFGHHCAYCYGIERITQDHLIPLSRGGSHTADNVVPACYSCNSSKGARTHVEFLLRFGSREDDADALLR